ncbi:hypothetical protein BD410DRAFT_548911 [Rickenella mellea]|uniref:Uncharacterized protein n=1 Tax=Rickenella mellea TaxID=50990 RepID=A0A4Y7PQS4_9AGAM|nr:hypothetical protein BD410DRAFT_548911 [Rickenella mellea]
MLLFANTSSSSLVTSTTSSTIPGIGMISGRAIKHVGEQIIQIAEEPVIWRRLRTIRRDIENESRRREVFSDPEAVFHTIDDLIELQKSSGIIGLSRVGYPKRINQTAATLLQLTRNCMHDAVPVPWFTGNNTAKLGEFLLCFCNLYWVSSSSSRQMAGSEPSQTIGTVTSISDLQFELVDQILQIIRSKSWRKAPQQDTMDHCLPIFLNFAVDFSHLLLRHVTADLATLLNFYRDIAAIMPSVISAAEYYCILERGFRALMTSLGSSLGRKVDYATFGMRVHLATYIFEPLIDFNKEYSFHLYSLLGAFVPRSLEVRMPLLKELHTRGFKKDTLQFYRRRLPVAQTIASINVEFIMRLLQAVSRRLVALDPDHRTERNADILLLLEHALDRLTKLSSVDIARLPLWERRVSFRVSLHNVLPTTNTRSLLQVKKN